MAAEVYNGGYEGDMADIWLSMVTLVILLVAVLPWDKPTRKDERFLAFMAMKYHHYSPFSRTQGQALELVKSMLSKKEDRITLHMIESNA